MSNDKSSTMSDYLDTNPTQNVRSAFDVITGSSGGRRRHQVDVHPGRERVLGPGRQPFDSCRSSAVCGRRRLSASFFFLVLRRRYYYVINITTLPRAGRSFVSTHARYTRRYRVKLVTFQSSSAHRVTWVTTRSSFEPSSP